MQNKNVEQKEWYKMQIYYNEKHFFRQKKQSGLNWVNSHSA